MDRRQCLALVGASCIPLAGCASDSESSPTTSLTSTTPSTTSFPKSLATPQIPQHLNRTNALDYAKEYERAVVYNGVHREGTTWIDVGCDAVVNAETDDGFYVIASCSGSSTSESGHIDYGPTIVLYFVTQEQVVRIPQGDEPDVEEKEVTPVTSTTSDSSELEKFGLRAYNVAEDTHSLTLTFTALDQSRSIVILDEHRLDPRTGFKMIASLPRGEYRLEARLDTDETATRQVAISPESKRKWATYITPSDTVFVRKWPESIRLW